MEGYKLYTPFGDEWDQLAKELLGSAKYFADMAEKSLSHAKEHRNDWVMWSGDQQRAKGELLALRAIVDVIGDILSTVGIYLSDSITDKLRETIEVVDKMHDELDEKINQEFWEKLQETKK